MDRIRKVGERLMNKEKIEGAVIQYDGEDFVAPNHALAWVKIMEKYGPMAPLDKEMARGFKTTRGRIVDEEEARGIALKAEQVAEEDLMTEDEYPLSQMLADNKKKEEGE